MADPKTIRKILLCSGKVYYEVLAAREARKATDETAAHTAIVRVEQLYPFPEAELRAVIARYSAASGVVWVQEEPRNMGAWIFMRTRLQRIMANEARALGYAGRPGERFDGSRVDQSSRTRTGGVARSRVRAA